MSRGVRASGYRARPPRVTRRRWEQLAVALAVTAIVIASAALFESVTRSPSQSGLVCSEVFHPDNGAPPFPVFFSCSRSRP